MRSRRMVLLTILSVMASVCIASGQITNVTDDQATPTPGIGHDYIHLLTETVNPANGSVSVRIQLPIPKSRGITIPLSIGYDSNGLAYGIGDQGRMFWSGNADGWDDTLPKLDWQMGSIYDDNGFDLCDYDYDFIFYDPMGGRHALGLSADDNGDCNTYPPPAGEVLSWGDGTVDAETQSYGDGAVTVADADGTVYSFSGSNGGLVPDYVEDRNGNKATFTASWNPPIEDITEIDSTGRTVVSLSSSGRTISGFSSPYTSTSGTASYNYTPGASLAYTDGQGCYGPGANTGTATVITSITLPNGKSYHFYYDPTYGLLNEIVYPTGGWVKYTWGINSLSEAVSFGDSLYNTPTGCIFRYGTPAIMKRQVSFDGTNVAEEQDFAYTTNWGGGSYVSQWASKSTTVTRTATDAPNSKTVYTYGCYDFSAQPDDSDSSPLCIPAETQVVYEDGSGTPLRTVNKTWEDDPHLDKLLVDSEQTILNDTGATSQVTYTYGRYSLLTKKVEKNYDGSTRTTNITYATGITGAIGHEVADRPSSVVTLDGSTEVAETDYTYDGYGNALTKTVKCLDGCPGGTGDVTTTYTYDGYGQVASKKDPNRNTTRYSYMCSDTYLSQIAYQDNTTKNFTYDCPSGELLSSQDQSGATTTYSYTPPCTGTADPLDRLGEISYPDGGETSFCYSDNALSPSVTTDKVIGNGVSDYVSTSTMDGLGHVVQTALTSDPGGTDYKALTYDGEGQLYKQSNPYRSTSDPTYGVTTFNHDALGRLTSTVYPDGSTASVSYSGNCATTTDPAGKTNETCKDAWGRLTSDIDGVGNTTTYGYDALDNLTSVIQGNQSRSFQYNSLSEVYQATNPESGTRSYTYDADGNVLSKTSANNTTISYTYDSLNRVLSKRSTDGVASPTSCYQYDQSSGRLINEWTQSATANGGLCAATMPTSGTTLLTSRSILLYDAMSRVKKEQTCVYPTCTTTTAQYPMSYTYDLVGHITSYTNGNDSILYTNTYNAAGQLSSIDSTLTGPKYPTPLFSFPTYSAADSLSGASYGTGTGITLCRSYDNRLRVTGEIDTAGAIQGAGVCPAQ